MKNSFEVIGMRRTGAERYCVVVTDPVAARTFCHNNTMNSVINSTTHMFNSNSKISLDFDTAQKQFRKLDSDNAWCHAMSLVLEKYGMGITIPRSLAPVAVRNSLLRLISRGSLS